MSSDLTYKHERDQAERQRVRERIKKELTRASKRRRFIVEMFVDESIERASTDAARARLMMVSGVFSVEVV